MTLFAQRNNRNNLSNDFHSQDDQLRNDIINNFLTPAYIQDITDTIKWRYLYRKIGENLETISKLLSAASIILAFSAGAFSTISALSYSAGVTGVIGLTSMQIASYAMNESKECNTELNKLLSSLTIKKMPDLDPLTSELPNILHNNNINISNDNMYTSARNLTYGIDNNISSGLTEMTPYHSRQLCNSPFTSGNTSGNTFGNAMVSEVV